MWPLHFSGGAKEMFWKRRNRCFETPGLQVAVNLTKLQVRMFDDVQRTDSDFNLLSYLRMLSVAKTTLLNNYCSEVKIRKETRTLRPNF